MKARSATAASREPPAEKMPERALQAERIECLLRLRVTAPDAGPSPLDVTQLARRASAIEEMLAYDEESRLLRLAATFGLAADERDLIALLWVLAHRPAWRHEFLHASGQLAIGSGVVTWLFGHPASARLSSESPLLLWEIASEEERGDGVVAVSLDPHVLAWLEGTHELDRHLVGAVQILSARLTLPSWPVSATAARARVALTNNTRVRVRVSGSDMRAREEFAAAVARDLGLPLLGADERFLEAEGARRFIRLQRQAFLDRCAPAWRGTDGARSWTRVITWFPLQFLLAGADDPRPANDGGVCEIDVHIASPDASERRMLWRHALGGTGSCDEAEIGELADRYPAQLGDIEKVVAASPQSAAEARARLREHSRVDLGPFAQRLECPYAWGDLVVPRDLAAVLGDLAFEASDRPAFWEQAAVRRLYPQGRGLIALFCGSPGTGKTMAAQVIAAELGLDLWRVDLSSVISKWVGETSQHIQRILTLASERNCALFFDEADALYGKRVHDVKDAQDRFANMDVSHLMVAIESFDGLVLLASNLKANIDPAFLRRIRYCCEFPRPDRPARAAIWQSITQTMWAPQTLAAEPLARLAEIDATGAQIKNACLTAAFVARRRGVRIDELMLVEALNRELAKDGGGLSPRELAKWLPE